jgi:hypothetical protein
MGISIGLTNSQIEEAMKAGATRDPAIIAKLTPEQIEYLDAQIKSGAGMAGLILGNITWGDRLDKPSLSIQMIFPNWKAYLSQMNRAEQHWSILSLNVIKMMEFISRQSRSRIKMLAFYRARKSILGTGGIIY